MKVINFLIVLINKWPKGLTNSKSSFAYTNFDGQSNTVWSTPFETGGYELSCLTR